MYIINSCNYVFDVIIYELYSVSNVRISHWIECDIKWIKFWDTEVIWEIVENMLVVDWDWNYDYIGSIFNRFRRTVFPIYSRHSVEFSIKFAKNSD